MTIKIKGKEYDEKKLTDQAKAWLAIMRDLQSNKVRLAIETEKNQVLITHYDKLIEEELNKIQ
tara:strand:+ start:210 stop:398 length:189 start_codon:yes stop_codon:yes gene_type:complete